MQLQLWNDLLWKNIQGGPYVYCPEHRMKLDIAIDGGMLSQDSLWSGEQRGLVCPVDEKVFSLGKGSFSLLQRRFLAALESADLKNAEIVSIDGYQIPIAKASTPKKDDEYWAEVRINDTKKGKQLVVYAGKRGDHDKAQIFIDPENDKISFDQNNIHPSDIFTRLTAEFDSGKKTTMEQ